MVAKGAVPSGQGGDTGAHSAVLRLSLEKNSSSKSDCKSKMGEGTMLSPICGLLLEAST